MKAISAFLSAIRKIQGVGTPSGPQEDRVFDPKIREEMKLAHSGRLQQKTQGYSGYGVPSEVEDVNYQQGGEIPSRFRRLAKQQKTSIPRFSSRSASPDGSFRPDYRAR